MADLTRPYSVQSFASNESLSFAPSMTTAPPSTVSLSANSSRFYLSDGNIKFKLDDGSEYNVHRSFFEIHSPKFAAEYLCNPHAEVVRLAEVSSVDFECFLSLIYPTAIGEYDIHTVAEWTSVLRLATKWAFDRLRALAMREIEPLADAVDKIVLAREFDLGDVWIIPALKELCAAPDWLEYEDAQRLGLRTVVEIGRAREKLRSTTFSPSAGPTTIAVSASPPPLSAKEGDGSFSESSPLPSPRPPSPLSPFERVRTYDTLPPPPSPPAEIIESLVPHTQAPPATGSECPAGTSPTIVQREFWPYYRNPLSTRL
ncbi:hypothetical protein K523DRAFT_351582 [Schizophyllum commune Tattone D]|nr:hypothetical protein K523DRAFT_351582 [Schizophyllum commune Tattone D]